MNATRDEVLSHSADNVVVVRLCRLNVGREVRHKDADAAESRDLELSELVKGTWSMRVTRYVRIMCAVNAMCS